MQICHLVIGDDHLNLLMLREKGKTRDPNPKDTLLSHEMSGEDNIPDLNPLSWSKFHFDQFYSKVLRN